MPKDLSDPQEAIEFCKELLSDLEDLPERAEEFVDSVTEKVTSMMEWIEENEHVTDKMQDSLRNMRRGCDRWMEG